MTILSWNCWGLAAASTVRELKGISFKYQPAIIFLMETRAPRERVDRTRRVLKMNKMFTVEPVGLAGGLSLLWNSEVEVQILGASQNYIHASILYKKGARDFVCTFIYGNPTFQRRRNLWNKISSLQPLRGSAWCCVGDFNELFSQQEKDGLRPQQQIRMDLLSYFVTF